MGVGVGFVFNRGGLMLLYFCGFVCVVDCVVCMLWGLSVVSRVVVGWLVFSL